MVKAGGSKRFGRARDGSNIEGSSAFLFFFFYFFFLSPLERIPVRMMDGNMPLSPHDSTVSVCSGGIRKGKEKEEKKGNGRACGTAGDSVIVSLVRDMAASYSVVQWTANEYSLKIIRDLSASSRILF